MSNIADDLLPRCTVRIAVRGKHAGSGFFVAPGLVATCGHVIAAPADPRTPVAVKHIAVNDAAGAAHEVEVVAAFQVPPDDDLALLKLRVARPGPCVLLDATPTVARDELHTFAYPKGHEEGLPRSLNAEGRTGAGQLAFTQGQVQRGMSGAPLLSLRTGGVCGVINRTRGQMTDLGGYAIPIASLLALHKRLRRDNEDYHTRSQEWLTALTQEQRLGWQAARARTSSTARRFGVTLNETDEGWGVSVDEPHEDGLEPVRVDLNAVKTQVARLFRDWAARGRLEEDEQILLLGRILFSAAFPGRIGDHLLKLLDNEGGDERLVLSVGFDPELDQEFRELPWEHLCLPEPHDAYLATDPRVGLTRRGNSAPAGNPAPPNAGRLSVLLVVVTLDPEVIEAIDAERIQERLRRTEKEAPGLVLEILVDPDIGELEDRLADRRPDVLHYAGYGRFRNDVDELALGAGYAGAVDYFDVEALLDCLPDAPPRLIVLEQYAGPRDPLATDFSVMGPRLLERGVDAVVAFQYSVAGPYAGQFNDALYKGLTNGELVEFAVQMARERLRRQRRSFVSPALFVSRPGMVRLTTPGVQATIERESAFATTNA